MRVVGVENAGPALPEEQALAVQIILEILMLGGADVVRLEVREHPDLKGDAVGAVQHQGLGGDLHDRAVHARFDHFPQIFLDHVGLGRGVGGGNVLLPDDRLDGPDETHAVARVLEDGAHHVGSGGLALGPRDADHRDLLCRIAEPGGRGVREAHPGVRDRDDGHLFGKCQSLRQRMAFLHHHSGRSRGNDLGKVAVAVAHGSRDGDEEAALSRSARIIDHIFDITVRVSLHAGPRKTFQQFL